MSALLLTLCRVETSQAFSFCFSFGSGGGGRADHYTRPYNVPVFPAAVYPVYPYSPPFYGGWYGMPWHGLQQQGAGYPRGDKALTGD